MSDFGNGDKLSFGQKVSCGASIAFFVCLALLIVLLFGAMLWNAPGQYKLLVLLAGGIWWLIGFLSMKGIMWLESGCMRIDEKEKWVPAIFGILGLMMPPFLLIAAIKELHWQLIMHGYYRRLGERISACLR
jgi:hypothetical protein